MKGNVEFYFHGADYHPSIKLEFHDGVFQSVLRKLMKTEVRITLNQDSGEEDEYMLIPFRLFVEVVVRRGLVPYTRGHSE